MKITENLQIPRKSGKSVTKTLKKERILKVSGFICSEKKMNFLLKLWRTLGRLFTLNSLLVFLTLAVGAYLIVWNFFSKNPTVLGGIILVVLIVLIIKRYKEYY